MAKDSPNAHIDEYLEYYADFAFPPGFAVMLNGAWGIGKTHLLKQFLQSQKVKGKKYAFVSLYGLSTIAEIDKALVISVLPIPNSKGIKVAGKLTSGIVERFGLDKILNKFNSKDILSELRVDIYAFDDLERCEAPLNKVLGYINELVEHDGCKVIVVANESELKESDEDEYGRRREKLIGKTLNVQSEFSRAFDYFVTKITKDDYKQLLSSEKNEIMSLYTLSKLDNLRILQQTIWDFERVFGCLEEKHKKNNAAMTAIIRMFFPISFDIKAGRISERELNNRSSSWLTGLTASIGSGQEVSESGLQLARRRYAGVDLSNMILSNQVLRDILVLGIIRKDEICAAVNASFYFVQPGREPAWRTLWFLAERTDEQAEKALHELEREFVDRKFIDSAELLQVIGIRLWLARTNILQKSSEEMVAECKQYIDDLYKREQLAPISLRPPSQGDLHFGNVDMRETETQEFKDVRAYFIEKRRLATEDAYRREAPKLLNLIDDDPDLFLKRINITNSEENIYYNIPILIYISPKEFVSKTLKAHPKAQVTIFRALRMRYEPGWTDRNLAPEEPWIQSVREEFLSAAATMSDFGRFRLSQLLPQLDHPHAESERDMRF